ncbi:MAG: hypothetical protein WC655_05770 [Candidatus Hydrogenedentales bacterium]|jgi:hypothetical protein
MSQTSNGKEKRQLRVQRMVRQIGQFDGWGATKRNIYEFTVPSNVVSSHSCLLPKFSITLRVGELRKLITNLEDDDGLTVTVAEHQASQFTFVR